MQYHNDTKIYKISYLLMSDTIDRLDMILLELRHLQRNIIYFMHEPSFNAVLRFEEDFLWGDKWEKSLPVIHSEKEVNEIICSNILLFPSPSLKERKIDTSFEGDIRKEDDKIREKIETNLRKRIDHLWNNDEWGLRYRKNYDSLRGTQLLKRVIVKEKIKFLLFSINDAGILPGERKQDTMNHAALAQFIILRSAIHQRCTQHLTRLMEYQSLFNKVLDIGVKEFPVPSLERRREIGIYMDFLNHSVRAVYKQTRHLVHRLFEEKYFSKNTKKDTCIILHSWKHHFTSEHHFQKPHDQQEDVDSGNLHHITTNYWMPERFDLRPIIAHEIAHLVAQEHFDGLSDKFLQYDETSRFAEMLRSMFRVCREYDAHTGIGEISPSHRPRALINEITCDLLAASVKCFSYLYAALLENLGQGLYKHLISGNLEFISSESMEIDLDLIRYLDGTGNHPATMRRDWWLRLKVMICWLRKVHHVQPLSGLDLLLLEGTDHLLDNLMIFFDKIAPPERQCGAIWINFAKRLCEVIEDSKAIEEVKQWRKERSRASRGDRLETGEIFPRAVQELDENLVNILKKIHIGLKISEGKALSDISINDELEEKFHERYLFDSSSGSHIYNHLYDIPWKCSLTRAIDLFGNTDCQTGTVKNRWLEYYKDAPKEKLLHILHHDHAIGRELHSLALESYMLKAENPIDRMIHAVRLMKKQNEKAKNSIINNYIKRFDVILRNNRHAKYGPYNMDTRKEIRKTEDDAKKDFFNFIYTFKDTPSTSLIANFIPLRNYLSFHANRREVVKVIFNEMTHVNHGDGSCKLHDKKKYVRCFRMLLVSRHTAGGFYSLEKDEIDHMTDRDKLNPVGLLKERTYWLWPDREKIAAKKKNCAYPFEIFRYSNVSGRYDAMSFVRVRQMRRCLLPHFETKDGNGELWKYHFPSVLSRREFGIKIDLNFTRNCDLSKLDEPKEYQNTLAGYISVVLKRRSLRLPFLARLLASAQGGKSDHSSRNELWKYISEEKILANYLQNTDTALLLDGSADFLLVLRDQPDVKKLNLPRIDAVMNLAYWLHQDFMVDRTEIILTASALDSVAKHIANNLDSPYSLDCEIRCFEDRFLGYRLDEVREKLTKNAGKGKGKDKLLVTFEITAGRKDFLLRFFNKETESLSNLISATCWHFDEFRDGLENLLNIRDYSEDKYHGGFAYIDRVEVNVNRKPPTLEEEGINNNP